MFFRFYTIPGLVIIGSQVMQLLEIYTIQNQISYTASKFKKASKNHCKLKIAVFGSSLENFAQYKFLDKKNSLNLSMYLSSQSTYNSQETNYVLNALISYIDFNSYYKKQNLEFDEEKSGIVYIRIMPQIFPIHNMVNFINNLYCFEESCVQEDPKVFASKLDKLNIKIILISNYEGTRNPWITNFIQECAKCDMLIILNTGGASRIHIEDTSLPECLNETRNTDPENNKGYIIFVNSIEEESKIPYSVGLISNIKYDQYFYYMIDDHKFKYQNHLSCGIVTSICTNIWSLNNELNPEEVIKKLNENISARTAGGANII